MWADTLLAVEQAHLFRLLVWGAACVLAGAGLLALVARQGRPAPLLRHFALQTEAWGSVVLAWALVARRMLDVRDLAGATQLDRVVWLSIGLDAGYVVAGLTLAAAGWRLGRRLAPVGAGLGIVVQGLALGLLHLLLAAHISR